MKGKSNKIKLKCQLIKFKTVNNLDKYIDNLENNNLKLIVTSNNLNYKKLRFKDLDY